MNLFTGDYFSRCYGNSSQSISGTATGWIHSYFSNSRFSLAARPNISCWGSTGFPSRSTSLLPLHARRKNPPKPSRCFPMRLYADDTPMYLHLNSQHQADVTCLRNCIQDIKHWLAQNVLQLNENKTAIILYSPPMAQNFST